MNIIFLRLPSYKYIFCGMDIEQKAYDVGETESYVWFIKAKSTYRLHESLESIDIKLFICFFIITFLILVPNAAGGWIILFLGAFGTFCYSFFGSIFSHLMFRSFHATIFIFNQR